MHTILLVRAYAALQVLGITDHPHVVCGVSLLFAEGVLAVEPGWYVEKACVWGVTVR